MKYICICLPIFILFYFSCGEYKTKKLPDGTFEIVQYKGDDTNITIPSNIKNIPITSIGNTKEWTTGLSIGAFQNKQIASVNLPEGITEIKENAFADNKINEITIPQSIRIIEKGAFQNNNINKVAIPEGIIEIGDMAFSNNQIDEVDLPSTLDKIGYGAFYKNNLKNVILPAGLTIINDYAFSNNAINQIIIPESVTMIGISAFENNQIKKFPNIKQKIMIKDRAFAKNEIAEVSLNSGTSISQNTFEDNSITKFSIAEGFKNVGAAPKNQIASLTLPSTTEYIIPGAFQNNNISRIIIPNHVKEIGESSFQGNKITSLRIPKSVEKIGSYAFADNPIESVTIENKSISIGQGNFSSKVMNNITKQISTSLGYEDLMRQPDKWQGKAIKISGKISQILDPNSRKADIFLDLSGTWELDTKRIHVSYNYDDNEERYLNNDRVIIWGTFIGMTDKFRSSLDILGLNKISMPDLSATIIERQK